MNIVQSWYPPKNLRNSLSNLIIFYINQYYLNKHNIFTKLYTTKDFTSLVEDLNLDVDVELLKQIPSNNKCIAYSKMLVLQNNPINTFHIDMDMIFRNPQTLIDYLAQDFDGSAWNEEVALIEHNGGYKTTLDTLNKFTSNIYRDIDEHHIYNTGIIGWKNEEFRCLFLTNYFKIAKEINDSYGKLFNYWLDISTKQLNPTNFFKNVVTWSPTFDLVNEQNTYTQIATLNNFKISPIHNEKFYCLSELESRIVNFVDRYYSRDDNSVNNRYWKEDRLLGIEHLFGGWKYSDGEIRRLYKELKATSYYEIFIKNITKRENTELCKLLSSIVVDPNLDYIFTTNKKEHDIAMINFENNIKISDYPLIDVFLRDDGGITFDYYPHKINTNKKSLNHQDISLIFNELRQDYSWVGFVNQPTNIDIEKFDSTYDIIKMKDVIFINSHLTAKQLVEDVCQFNILDLD